MYIYILGREKDLCLAELEAKLGSVHLMNDEVASSEISADIGQLGGSIKTGRIVGKKISNLSNLQGEITKILMESGFESKFSFGLSYYGKSKMNFGPIGIKIKRELQKSGLKPRLVLPKSDNRLNAASVKHNKLISSGREFIIIQNNDSMSLAITEGVQDIDDYSKRDYDKPCRDRKVGMLPPKLSQIMINLARPKPQTLIVDPFCGSGGLLMEASLMGYESSGSDISDNMINCSNENIEWFKENYPNFKSITVDAAIDATKKILPNKDYVVVTEGFLGTNFLSNPTKNLVMEQVSELKDLYIRFFKNILDQKTLPDSVCTCFPFWKFNDGTVELNLIDEIANLGYTITEFKSVRRSILNYHREGQFTGRQIVVFKPNKEKSNVKD
jgi:tRNA G10  N-methylase Trm11